MMYFLNMPYAASYNFAKFKLKSPPMHGEIKKINYVKE
jgi:hypothetical protein